MMDVRAEGAPPAQVLRPVAAGPTTPSVMHCRRRSSANGYERGDAWCRSLTRFSGCPSEPPYARILTGLPLARAGTRNFNVHFGSRTPVCPLRERPFRNFAPAAPAERPVQVVKRSFEILTGERPVGGAALRLCRRN